MFAALSPYIELYRPDAITYSKEFYAVVTYLF